jgi:prefoldin subunit 5
MEQIVLSSEELQLLKNLKNKQDQLIFNLGQNEYLKKDIQEQINSILDELKKIKQEGENIGKSLNEKYGDGNIDLNTGIFSKI